MCIRDRVEEIIRQIIFLSFVMRGDSFSIAITTTIVRRKASEITQSHTNLLSFLSAIGVSEKEWEMERKVKNGAHTVVVVQNEVVGIPLPYEM